MISANSVKPSMNEAHEKDPYNNSCYGTIVDSGSITSPMPRTRAGPGSRKNGTSAPS